ncbi:hypothetical protein CANCADRAFT_97063 [Tortispora caseinolytica NRRL Y-17796]|uniref:SYO1-like TPR repeats domain-containing protein n=1 Tax=Tortispora caseinolytica NRRL Y-17796 TaxID=767744 RepID=A0A1E4TDM9_9ASCO|nr:hypothetical protein CANCADRAFT_97063 [Tortispora caseinolytica NRRL Y-17796]
MPRIISSRHYTRPQPIGRPQKDIVATNDDVKLCMELLAKPDSAAVVQGLQLAARVARSDKREQLLRNRIVQTCLGFVESKDKAVAAESYNVLIQLLEASPFDTATFLYRQRIVQRVIDTIETLDLESLALPEDRKLLTACIYLVMRLCEYVVPQTVSAITRSLHELPALLTSIIASDSDDQLLVQTAAECLYVVTQQNILYLAAIDYDQLLNVASNSEGMLKLSIIGVFVNALLEYQQALHISVSDIITHLSGELGSDDEQIVALALELLTFTMPAVVAQTKDDDIEPQEDTDMDAISGPSTELIELLKSTVLPASIKSLQNNTLRVPAAALLNNLCLCFNMTLKDDETWTTEAANIWDISVNQLNSSDVQFLTSILNVVWAVSEHLASTENPVTPNLELFQAISNNYNTENPDLCFAVTSSLAAMCRMYIGKDDNGYLQPCLDFFLQVSIPKGSVEEAVEALNAIFDTFADKSYSYDQIYVDGGYNAKLSEIGPAFRRKVKTVSKQNNKELRVAADAAALNLQRFISYKNKE